MLFFQYVFPWNYGKVMESMKPQLRLVDFELPEVTGHPGNGDVTYPTKGGKGKSWT